MRKAKITSEIGKGLQSRREFIESLLASDAEKHHTAAEKLTLLNLLFKQKTFSLEQEFQIEAMGVLLGDALCQVLNLEWVMVEHDEGTFPAVAFPGTMIFSYPIDAVIKRIEKNEEVDVFYLFVGMAETMAKMLKSGEYKNG